MDGKADREKEGRRYWQRYKAKSKQNCENDKERDDPSSIYSHSNHNLKMSASFGFFSFSSSFVLMFFFIFWCLPPTFQCLLLVVHSCQMNGGDLNFATKIIMEHTLTHTHTHTNTHTCVQSLHVIVNTRALRNSGKG